MPRPLQRLPLLPWYAALVAIAGCSLARSATAQGNEEARHRVRSSDPSITALIDRAIDRSPTFKKLAASVDASNGIVYVEGGVCAGHVAACLPMWMHSSGANRLLRIVLDGKRLDSDVRSMRAIGHELQHALEVLSEPSITGGRQMFFFYQRYEPTSRQQFETMAAIHAGDAVEDELRAWHKKAP